MTDIHGIEFEGELIAEHTNTYVYRTNDGKTYVVRKDKTKPILSNKTRLGRFNLSESQQLKRDPNHTSWRRQYAY